MWARTRRGAREVILRLTYQADSALWKLTLKEDGSDFWEGEDTALESLTAKAVVALGKTF
jgi:hypothetical protein